MTTENRDLPSVGSSGGAVAAMISCPFCAEQIQAAAKKCRHCGEYLDVTMRKAQEAPLFAASPSGSAAASASSSTTVVVRGHSGMNHALHIVLCVLTFGVWIPFYILIAIIHGMGKR
jgi:ABC-type transport system involved in cytochrome bd biosynthesis fused ATPase/permease subunit